MSHVKKQALVAVLILMVVAGGTWLWFAKMEKRMGARIRISDAVVSNPLYAATRLLEKHGHDVAIAGTLAEALRSAPPDGTLILSDNGGVVTRGQADRLFAWVERGNTLIVRPKWSGRTSFYACGEQGRAVPPKNGTHDDADTDPVGTEYGLELAHMVRHKAPPGDEPPPATKNAEPPCLAKLTLAGMTYPLQLDVDRFALQSFDDHSAPTSGDDSLDAVRIYPRGAGRVVFIAQNYFDNSQLAWYDHAELLLGLTELGTKRHVYIVQHLDMPKWYEALWWQFRDGIIGAACLLTLLLWLAVRRFGPMLPDPAPERRALLEHIDASGRWLWKIPAGRDLLLGAARNSVERLLARRLPALLRLPPVERAREVARLCQLSADDVIAALIEPAAKAPVAFTRQIHTLSQLRRHHER
jgi:hypothetical protein